MSVVKRICYWCGKEASTREHVPPKCFFPDSVDSEGKKINRSQLITVWACREHNNKKSDFDEYIRNRIVIAANNQRAWENTESTLKSMYHSHDWERSVEFVNEKLEVKTYDENIGFAIESMARALYYHEFDKSLRGTCQTFYGVYKGDDKLAVGAKEMVTYYLKESENWDSPIKGAYPDIFTYRFNPTDELGNTVLLMCFYGSVYAVALLCNAEHEKERRKLSLPEAWMIVQQLGLDPAKVMHAGRGYNALEEDEKGTFIKE